MDAKIAGFIEESHCDDEGRRVIDKIKIEHISLVPDENGNVTMSPYTHIIGPGDGAEIEICDPEFKLFVESTEFKAWDELSDEVLEGFEKLVDESAPPALILEGCLSELDTISDWIDWLMEK